MQPLADPRAPADRRERLDHVSCADLDVDVDHRRVGVDDLDAGEHVPLVDRALGELAHARQRDAVVDAEHRAARPRRTCAATAAPSPRSTSSTCGRYSSPCALSALSRGSASRSARAVEHEDAGVDLADLALGRRSRRRAPWSRRRARTAPARRARRARSRSGRRARVVAIVAAAPPSACACASAAIASAPTQRHVAAQHEHRRGDVDAAAARVELLDRGEHGAAGAVRALLHGQLDAGRQHRLERARRRVDDEHASGAGRERRAHRPQHHRQPAQLVQHLRRARAHPRALARGEDQDRRRAHAADASSPSRRAPGAGRAAAAGGQGLEPRFSGPKPDVLPLDDPPKGHERSRRGTGW